MDEDYLRRRKRAKRTLVTAIRVIWNIQLTYRIPTSYVLRGFATIYRLNAFYDSFRWLDYAAHQIKKDESRGGH